MPMVNLNQKLDRHARRAPLKKKKHRLRRLIVILIILGLVIGLPLRGVYQSAKSLSANAKQLSTSVKNNNLDQIKQNVKAMKDSANGLNTSLGFLFWVKAIPYFGGFYGDGKHFTSALDSELQAGETLVNGLDPYKNDLGLNGQPTAGQDKIAQFVKILNKIIPNLGTVEPDLKAASNEVSGIDTNKYPTSLKGFPVKAEVETAKSFIVGADLAVTQAKDALLAAPGMLGEPSSKNYLILFQNDKELRPTGGFLTAYAFMKLDQGHLSTTGSDDIYRLDEKLTQACQTRVCPLTPPAPIVKYLPEADGKPRTAWSMRDSNISPDLPTAMHQFESMYNLTGSSDSFDGIITIDTEVVRSLIEITGPVEVYGTTYSADIDKRCNCPNVIYELENYSEIVAKGQDDRKAILGTLMQQVLAKALASSSQKLPELVSVAAKLAGGKHLMFYMHDMSEEHALAEINWTGQIKDTTGDYLHINDANFAGGKSNLYVTQKVELDIDTQKSDGIHEKLTVNYSNPQVYSSWLNGINRDYVRIYVPQGSVLGTSSGSQVPMTTATDLDKTYFDGFIQIRPQNSLTLVLNYIVPKFQYSNQYPILIQKQPGSKDFPYTVKINGQTKASFTLDGDKDLKL